MMNWLERYVENVKVYLPGNQRDDIGSELYSALQDQCDDMADSMGRAPTEAEVLALLKQKGHPMQVAAAYQPRRTLVSEALFPLYIQVLKWMLLAVFIATGVVAALSLFGQAEPDFTRAVLHWLAGTFDAGLHGFAWITLGFYLAGEGISYSDAFGKWDPRKLRNIVGGNQRISRFDSTTELVAMLVFMGWLNDLAGVVLPAAGEGVSFVFSAELRALLPWLNVAMGLSILMALHKFWMPFWTKAKLMLDGAINLYWLVLLALLFKLEQVFGMRWADPGTEPWDMPVNNWQIIVGIAIAVTGYDLLRNIQRYIRAEG